MIRQAICFGMVGASGVVVGLTVLNIVMWVVHWFLLANIVAFGVAVTWNFILNHAYTFERSRRPIVRQWAEFVFGCLGSSIVGWCVSCTLYATLLFFKQHYNIAALTGTALSAGTNFLWARFVVFNSESESLCYDGATSDACS